MPMTVLACTEKLDGPRVAPAWSNIKGDGNTWFLVSKSTALSRCE